MKKIFLLVIMMGISQLTHAWSIRDFFNKKPSFSDLYSDISYSFKSGKEYDPRFSEFCSHYIEITLDNKTEYYLKGVDAKCSLFDLYGNRLIHDHTVEFYFMAEIAPGNTVKSTSRLCGRINRDALIGKHDCRVSKIFSPVFD